MSAQISLLIKAVDEASEVVRRVAAETSGALEEVQQASENVAKAHRLTWSETKNLITSFSGLATSCFALYTSIDKVGDAQINLQRASLLVQQATNALEDAQNRYNIAVAKYGEESPQAQAALRDLQLAQERYNYAVERAQLIQSNYNELVFQTAITLIPSLITAVDSGVKAFGTLKSAVDAAGGALSFLAANPIVLVIAAVAALVSALIYLYNTNEDFRNAVNRLCETLANIFKPVLDAVIGALMWLWRNILEPLGRFVSGAFTAAWISLAAIWETLASVWNGFCRALSWGYETFIKPIADAIASLFAWIEALRSGFAYISSFGRVEVVEPAAVEVPELQRGGIVTEPTLAMLGEAGAEAVIPLEDLKPGVTVVFNAPMINVEGSIDEERLARLVEERLRSVIIEPTSRSASTRRIVVPRVAV